MQGDTIEMQPFPDTRTELEAIRRPSYLSEVFARALALFTFTRLRQTSASQPDGSRPSTCSAAGGVRTERRTGPTDSSHPPQTKKEARIAPGLKRDRLRRARRDREDAAAAQAAAEIRYEW